MVAGEDWRSDLERWLEPFLAGLSHPARRRMCPRYVAGLIGPGDRKGVQPMAARGGEVGYDQLHHFAAAGVWDSAPLEMALLSEADRLVGGAGAFLVIDDTAMPKKGRHSVGVAPRYASSLGKNANCPTMVSVTLASREVPVMVGLRLFLPENRTGNPARMTKAKVPADRQAALTKPEIAIEEIDRMRTAGVRFGCVLADAGHGMSAPFRQTPSERGLSRAVGIPGRQKAYQADVAMLFPVASHGRPRRHHIPDSKSVAAETLLAGQRRQRVGWRRGTKGRLTARFAALRVRVADGPTRRIRDKGNQHPPGEEVRLVGEHRATGERKHHLSNLPADTPLKDARWRCQSTVDLRAGASAAEGGTRPRSLRGAIMDRAAPTRADDDDSLRLPPVPPPHRRGTEKKSRGTTTATGHAGRQASDPRPLRTTASDAMPSLQ